MILNDYVKFETHSGHLSFMYFVLILSLVLFHL